jgi:hypothetical protein
MAFKPLKLLQKAAEILGSAVGIDVGAALKKIIDNPTPEQEAALQQYDLQMRELALKELETEVDAKVGLMVAEIKSEDAFVRRARPFGLYIFYAVTLVQVLVVSLVILMEMEIDYLGLTAAFGSIVGPLAGYSGWYTYNRTQDKKNAQ